MYIVWANNSTTPKSYSRITHWAKALFLKPSDLRAMFTAYFDESGWKDTPAFSVAGYVSTEEQWKRFAREWNEILGRKGIKVFHMVDFNQCIDEFELFQDKPEEAKIFLNALVGEVKVRVRMSFACILSPSDYTAVNEKFQLAESFGNMYSFCSRYCVGAVRRWAEKYKYPKDKIHYVFEDGCKGKGDLSTMMELDGFPPPTFRDKKLPHLQAADLVVWELRRVAGLAFGDSLQSFRESFKTLSQMPQDWGIYKNKQDLEDFCMEFGIARR